MPTDRVHRLPQQAQPRTLPPHRPQPAASDAATRPRHAHPGSEREALHPLRRAAPDPSRCTRYVALHPLRRNAPDQKGCNAYGSGAPPPTTSQIAGNSSPQTPAVRLGRCDTASTCSPGSEREALHPLRRATPVTSRNTRYVAIHPLRRATPVTSQCTRSEEVQCLRIGCTAPHNKPNRGHFLPTHPSGSIRRSHTTSKYPPGSEREALHPLRRNAPVTSRCTRSEGVQCLRIGCTAT